MSSMNQRTIIGVVLVAIVISAMGIILYSPSFQPEVSPPLDPLPPSDNPPTDYRTAETIQVGSLMLSANATVTGMIPHTGFSTYEFTLVVNITNTGNETISNFRAIKMSVYNIWQQLLRTFHLLPESNATISAGETLLLNYQNSDTHFEAPSRIKGASDYARVLVTFGNNQEAILTTPRIWGVFAIE